MKTVLVTGAAGFIGHAVCNRLILCGYEVIGIDNFAPFYDIKLKLDRVANIASDTRFTFEEMSITTPSALENLFRQYEFDYVINLAAEPAVRVETGWSQFNANVVGFFNILERCAQSGAKLIYASSSSVYGNNEWPNHEQQVTDSPISLYGATKKCNELLASAYHETTGLSTTGLRFFTVYGPWGRPDMAVYKFIDALYTGHPIELYNNGEHKRDWVYILDIELSIMALIHQLDKEDEKCCPTSHRIFNIGSGKTTPTRDAVEILKEITGKNTRIVNKPKQVGDVDVTLCDNFKLRDYTEFTPQTGLREGLRRTVDWYKQYHNIT